MRELYIPPATDLELQQSADTSSEIQNPKQIIRQPAFQTRQLFSDNDHGPLHQKCHSQFLTQICVTLFQKWIQIRFTSDSGRPACVGEGSDEKSFCSQKSLKLSFSFSTVRSFIVSFEQCGLLFDLITCMCCVLVFVDILTLSRCCKCVYSCTVDFRFLFPFVWLVCFEHDHCMIKKIITIRKLEFSNIAWESEKDIWGGVAQVKKGHPSKLLFMKSKGTYCLSSFN